VDGLVVLDSVDKLLSVVTSTAALFAGGFAFCAWWRINVTEPREKANEAERIRTTTPLSTNERREFFKVAAHNAIVLRATAKKDEERDFAGKAERLIGACNDSRDVYLLRRVMAAAHNIRGEVDIVLTPSESTLTLAGIDETDEGKSFTDTMKQKEGARLVSILVSSGVAKATDGGACAISADARRRLRTVVGYADKGDAFIPADGWDEALDEPPRSAFVPTLPIIGRVVR
jgi:hypothetical protein